MALPVKTGQGVDTNLNSDLAGGVHTMIHDVRASALPAGASTESTLAAMRSELQALGTTTDADATANGSLIAITKRLRTLVNSLVTLTAAGLPTSLSASGNLKVAIVEGAGSGGTAQADRSAFSEGVTSATPVSALFNDSSSDPTSGQAAALRMTSKRGLQVNLRNASGTEVGTNSNPVRTDPTGGSFQPVSDGGGSLTIDASALPLPTGAATSAKQAALGTAGSASSDVLSIQGVAGGTTLPVTVGNTLTVSAHAVTNAGTFAVQDSQKVADNAPFTDGTTPIQPLGYVFDEVAGTALTENDAAAARINANRAVVLVIEDDATRGRRAAVTASNALKVDNSAITQPVSGTVAATQSGTWNVGTVTPGTAATNLGKAIATAAGATDTGVALLGIRTDTLATISPAVGAWAAARVNSQGALHVTGAGGGTQFAVDTAAGATDTGTLLLAVRDDVLTTLTPADNDYTQLRVDSVGALQVSQAALTAATDVVGAVGTIAHDAVDSGNPLKIGGKAYTTAPTAVSVGDRVDAWFDTAGRLAVNDGGGSLTVDAASLPLPTGAATETTLAAIAADTSLTSGTQLTQVTPSISGGVSVFRDLDLDEAGAANIKASAGQVYGWSLYNTHATLYRFVKLYNKATGPTVGTDAPLITIAVPPASFREHPTSALGIPFSTGIGWAATTGVADTDVGAPGTNEIVAHLYYK